MHNPHGRPGRPREVAEMEAKLIGPDGVERLYHIMLSTDDRWILDVMGERAAKNPTGRSSALNGAIRVQATPKEVRPLSATFNGADYGQRP